MAGTQSGQEVSDMSLKRPFQLIARRQAETPGAMPAGLRSQSEEAPPATEGKMELL